MFGNGRKSISVFDFNELIKDVLLLCQSTLQSQSIDLKLNLYPQALSMTGDKSQMQQVILNLITNASESFLPTFQGDKHVSIQTTLENERIIFTVSDNGCGISPEIESLVFELLRTNKESGMGIGLWLSKTIVESHDGKIGYKTALNVGTSFRVELPSTSGTMFF
jgi:signal transduction histidine kinase